MSELIVVAVIAVAAIAGVVTFAIVQSRERAAETAAHRREVGELVNRIMARHLAEYSLGQSRLDSGHIPSVAADREHEPAVGL